MSPGWRSDPRRLLPPALLLVTVALASAPFLAGRYAFLLDMTVGPGWQPFAPYAFGFEPPTYGGSLPLLALLGGVGSVLGAGVAQKLLLVGVLALAAVAGYAFLPGPRWARCYGALLLVVNPFVYVRMLAGQWAVVWGLATLPVVLYAYTNYLEDPGPRALALAVGAITLLGFSAHLLYASAILLAAVTGFRYVDHRDPEVARRALTVALVAIPVNAYWLAPVVLGDGSALAGVSATDLSTFAPRGGEFSALYSTASMHGFWRGGYTYARDLFVPVEALYLAVLLLAEYGVVAYYDDEERGYVVKALAVTAVVALLLGAGVSGPAAPAFRWLFEHVPLFAGMRDSNKFVALLVLAYAYLGSLGVARLLERVRRVDRRRWLRVAVLALVVLAPLAYAFPMVTGYAGQVSSQDYPEEWHEVDRLLDADPGEYDVLFLPWHQYMDYDWLDGDRQRIASPARSFFSKPVVQGDNVEVGSVYSTSGNPVSDYVEFLFGLGPGNARPNVTNMGELLAEIDVNYVLLTKEVDWRDYDETLRDQRDLTLVLENDQFRVYRNDRRTDRAYATDRLTSVRNRSAFVAATQEGNASGVAVVNGTPAGRSTGGDGGRVPLEVVERSPAHDRVDGTTREYTVVTRSQATAGDGWRYDGAEPVGRHLGVQPVFASDPGGADVRYAPFYRLYLPSYGLSALAAVLLGWYGLTTRTDPATRLRERLRGRRRPIDDD